MVFDERPSPARVSAAAAAKLPRAVLLALIVAYIVSGLFGRDPWQEDDAAGFGIMWSMARFGEWLLPNVAGEPVAADGPLAFWVGAASVALFGKAIGDVAAARLPAIPWFFLATAALWYSTLRLAQRDEAQPVAFAFGGEATARDYGRMLADVAVLLLLGTIGPIVGLHETTSEPAAFALACTAIYGLVLSLRRPGAGALLCGFALGLLLLARGTQPTLWLLAAALLLVAGARPAAVRLRSAATLLAVAAALPAAWAIAVIARHDETGAAYLAGWAAGSLREFAWPSGEALSWLLRALLWYTWPLWPLAAWALYAWRQGLRHPHIALAAVLLAAQLAALATTRAPSANDLPFVVAPLAMLAAFGAISLRRAVENVIDWFAITAFSLFSAALWAYFFAWHSGLPPKMNTSLLRQTAGFVPPLDWGQVGVAAAATGLWLALVVWRVRRPSAVLWRGPILAATGLIMLWVAFSSLYLGAVDHRRSFAPLARAAAAEIARSDAPDGCVIAQHLRPSHRGVLAYHGGIRFARRDDAECPFALQRDLAGSLLDDSLPAGRWLEIWQGSRPGRPDELIRLFRRAGD
jgi:4-amino-4-deoxy-L-arabinose transferase-like glycosyltransferase